MLLGSLVVFRERFVSIQWLGLGLLVVGLLMFFDDDLPALMSGNRTLVVGLALLVGAAVMWGCYALAQKQLLNTLSSSSIMVVIYVAASVMLLPFSSPAGAASLDGVGIALLAFLAVNTLVAYGAFAEALEHLEASRVSVIVSMTPIVTIAAVTGGARLLPSVITRESLSIVSLAGAGLVVAGSMLGALGRARARGQRTN
jgi:drug/metabolite transporter (DMT)-like permease